MKARVDPSKSRSSSNRAAFVTSRAAPCATCSRSLDHQRSSSLRHAANTQSVECRGRHVSIIRRSSSLRHCSDSDATGATGATATRQAHRMSLDHQAIKQPSSQRLCEPLFGRLRHARRTRRTAGQVSIIRRSSSLRHIFNPIRDVGGADVSIIRRSNSLRHARRSAYAANDRARTASRSSGDRAAFITLT
jgi:hypothetical protein